MKAIAAAGHGVLRALVQEFGSDALLISEDLSVIIEMIDQIFIFFYHHKASNETKF